MAVTNITEERDQVITGANRCMAALKAMDALAEADNHGGATWKNVWESEKAISDLLIRASGAETQFLRGFMATLAEYIDMCNKCGIPNLEVWKPSASMTETELIAYRNSRTSEA